MLISFQHTLTSTLAALLITRYLNLRRGNRGGKIEEGWRGVCAGGGDEKGRNKKRRKENSGSEEGKDKRRGGKTGEC